MSNDNIDRKFDEICNDTVSSSAEIDTWGEEGGAAKRSALHHRFLFCILLN